MFTWSRHKEKASATGLATGERTSLLRLGRESGSSHADWIHHAIQELRLGGGAERIGVWLDELLGGWEPNGIPVIFRGEVWEHGIGSGPPGWTRLSNDLPLPKELLEEGKSCQYDLEGPYAGLILGPLVGLGCALWVPVTAQRSLRGMVMLGARSKRADLPRDAAEKIAEELGMLLELEESRVSRPAGRWTWNSSAESASCSRSGRMPH